jgi:hypothetical protein
MTARTTATTLDPRLRGDDEQKLDPGFRRDDGNGWIRAVARPTGESACSAGDEGFSPWIPAFAGMTAKPDLRFRGEDDHDWSPASARVAGRRA